MSPAETAPVPHPTRSERADIGKKARQKAPLAALADYESADGRRDPVELLGQEDASRVADLVPIRYGRMLTSPFAFYRGAAVLMAGDLATTSSPGLSAQLCGDAHMSNFGIFGSPERRLLFDVNDFDETHPGPFEWDVKRLAASLEIAGRGNGFTKKQRNKIVLAGSERLPESHAQLREAVEPRGLVRQHRHGPGHVRVRRPTRSEASQSH